MKQEHSDKELLTSYKAGLLFSKSVILPTEIGNFDNLLPTERSVWHHFFSCLVWRLRAWTKTTTTTTTHCSLDMYV